MLDALLRSLCAPCGRRTGSASALGLAIPRRTGGGSGRIFRRQRPALEYLEERTLLSVAFPNAHAVSPVALTPAAGGAFPIGLNPAQVRYAYGFDRISFANGSVAANGSGQTIAIIDAYDQPNLASDLASFDATYGIAAPASLTKVNENGGAALPAASQSWGLEESLDVEWAHAIAPGARILLVEANSANWSDLLAAVNYARSQPGVSVVSMSFGGAEWSGESSLDSSFTTPAGHAGVTFVASSGDAGSSGAPESPSVSPNVLAVGGTQLSLNSDGTYRAETAWGGSGGGVSAFESQPAYQRGVVTQSSTRRAVPDVAYDASSGSPFAVYDTSGYGGWLQVYGTSAGAPQWAALVAIADQGRALAGKGALDGASQTLPMLYKLPASDFHDVTTGSNGGFSAGPGYDLVTGRGTPVANLVVAALAGSSPTPPPPNQPPRVVTPARASVSAVAGTTVALSVLGTDPEGGRLTYTWSVVGAPAGAPTPTFSANGSSASNTTTATFYRAGTYTFRVVLTDPAGLTATSSVSVTVAQTQTYLAVLPGSISLADGGLQQFTANASDQFGNAMARQPALSWSVTGGGTITGRGLFTAPGAGTGVARVRVSGGGLSVTATVIFAAGMAAPSRLVATPIWAGEVYLSWRETSPGATGFVVERSTDGGPWTAIGKANARATFYFDATTTAQHVYDYRVYALSGARATGFSNTTGWVRPAVSSFATAASHPDSSRLNEPSFNANWLAAVDALLRSGCDRRPSAGV